MVETNSVITDYVGKVLIDEANKGGGFMTEAEIAFAVTGKMYVDGVRHDKAIHPHTVKAKMKTIRTMCDEKSLLLMWKDREVEEGEPVTEWKIATGADIEYIAETYLGVAPKKEAVADEQPVETPEADGSGE